MARTVSIVGAGRVGTALGKLLRGLGWHIGAVVTRSSRTAGAAVRAMGGGMPCRRLTSDLFAADVILLGTPDRALPGLARSLAEIGGEKCRGKIVLHASATLDRGVLAPFARRGALTGSLHPMQAFGGEIIPKLNGIIFTIEGDRRARRVARQIARSLGGVPVVIDSRDKAIYHASAVLAAGSIYALTEAGIGMLVGIGFTRQRAMQTLLPLLRQIPDNIERIGPRAAWTGPLSRGDYAIVAKHVVALRRYPREFQQSYAALALLAGRVLSRKPAAALKQIERALKNSKGEMR